MKEYNYYYFDFDGTLANSFPSLIHPFQVAFATENVFLSEDDVKELMHMAFIQMCDKLGIHDEKKMVHVYEVMNVEMNKDEEISKITIFPEAKETLAYLKEHHKRIAVVSGNHTDYIHRVMEIHHLKEYFDFYVGGNSTKEPKPYPEPLLKAMELSNNPSKSECVYIGDSLQDPECAKNAGIDGILIDRKREYPDYPSQKILSLKELFYE